MNLLKLVLRAPEACCLQVSSLLRSDKVHARLSAATALGLIAQQAAARDGSAKLVTTEDRSAQDAAVQAAYDRFDEDQVLARGDVLQETGDEV